MDHKNDLDKCRRCIMCDSAFGMSIKNNNDSSFIQDSTENLHNTLIVDQHVDSKLLVVEHE